MSEDEMIHDDEMLPSPPMNAGPEGSTPIEDELAAELLADVPKMGEPIPIGTYHFRLDSFKEQWTQKDDKGRELTDDQKQPYFACQWKCQQEPHTGRVVFENVPWVRAQDARDANNSQSPRRAEAKNIINKRLGRAKEIMEAAGFQPVGNFGFKQFLGTNPEMKLQLKLKERQAKGPDGQYKGTGEWGNEVQKHLSLHRPA